MRIGIIAAMKHEMDLLLDELIDLEETKYLGYTIFSGTVNEHEVFILESGMGKVNASMATTILISEFSAELIINTGIAGGISPSKTTDVIIGTRLMYNDVDARVFNYEYGQVPQMPRFFQINPELLVLVKKSLNKANISFKEGLIVSGDKFISSIEPLKEVIDLNPLATEMEGCAVAQVATRAGVDFLIIRYISDVIGLPSQIEDYFEYEDKMSKESALITKSILNNL